MLYRIWKSLHVRRTVLVAADMAIITAAYFAAYWLRQLGDEFPRFMKVYWHTLPWLLGIRFLCGILVRQYTWSFRMASLSEAAGIFKAVAVGSILFFLRWRFSDIPLGPPRSIYAMEFALSLMGMLFIRFFPRYAYQQFLRNAPQLNANGEVRMRTIIFGAGGVGELILRDLIRTRIYPYDVVGFVDDDPSKHGTSMHGYRVLGASEDLPELIERYRVDKILVAIPGLPAKRLREVVDTCSEFHIRFKIVPDYANLVTQGEAAPITLQDIRLEDLLERDPVDFDHAGMAEFFVDRTVLVTGAAGSIGSEICRQGARQGIRKLVLVDLNENDLYFLRLDLADIAPRLEPIIEIANVREAETLDAIFSRHKPHIVFHAAAHKHVPLVENCPAEGVKNNVLGSHNAAAAALAHGTDCFILISTDKAVRPTNVMGATKRLAEHLVLAQNGKGTTRFMAVRFGNVLGSNGSLVQILQRQIAKGGPVTITHPKITRYFMTIPEAVGLVIVAGVQSESTLCVLDMGKPLNVDSLAREMISLSGLIPDRDIEIVYTGLRPGEKMYEELFTEEEHRRPSAHPRIFLAEARPTPADPDAILAAAREAALDGRDETVRAFLRTYLPDYQQRDPAAPGTPARDGAIDAGAHAP